MKASRVPMWVPPPSPGPHEARAAPWPHPGKEQRGARGASGAAPSQGSDRQVRAQVRATH